jgi:hypothetical protein
MMKDSEWVKAESAVIDRQFAGNDETDHAEYSFSASHFQSFERPETTQGAVVQVQGVFECTCSGIERTAID